MPKLIKCILNCYTKCLHYVMMLSHSSLNHLLWYHVTNAERPLTLSRPFNILYSSEILGYNKSKDIERIHMKFCKIILNVRQNTWNASVYGDLGWYRLFINRYVRIIKFWCSLVITENIILQKVYEQSLYDCHKGCNNWVTDVIL
jgi:hypothetical protein